MEDKDGQKQGGWAFPPWLVHSHSLRYRLTQDMPASWVIRRWPDRCVFFFFPLSFFSCHCSDAKPRVRGMKATRVIQCHGSEHPAALWVQQTAASLSALRAAARGVLRGRHSSLMTPLPPRVLCNG